jgi:hypothetical protein
MAREKCPQSDFRREDAEYCDYHEWEGKALCVGCNEWQPVTPTFERGRLIYVTFRPHDREAPSN